MKLINEEHDLVIKVCYFGVNTYIALLKEINQEHEIGKKLCYNEGNCYIEGNWSRKWDWYEI